MYYKKLNQSNQSIHTTTTNHTMKAILCGLACSLCFSTAMASVPSPFQKPVPPSPSSPDASQQALSKAITSETGALFNVNSLLTANNATLQALFQQKDPLLTTAPSTSNHTLQTAFSPQLNYGSAIKQNGLQLITSMFKMFHQNYNQTGAPTASAPPLASLSPSDSILTHGIVYIPKVVNGIVVSVPSTGTKNDAQFNFSMLISQDFINPGIADPDNNLYPDDSPTLKKIIAQAAPNAETLQELDINYCQQLTAVLATPKQDLAGSINAPGLTKIAQDPDLTNKLAADSWSDTSSDDNNNNASDPNKQAMSEFDKNLAYKGSSKPYYSEFTQTVHAVDAAKTIGASTIDFQCMERTPRYYLDPNGKKVIESPLQHMGDQVNQIALW